MKKNLLLIFCFLPAIVFAHVKWFSNFNFSQPPLTLEQLNIPAFWGLLVLSLVSLPVLVWVDNLGEKTALYHKVNSFLDRYSNNSLNIMRIAIGAVLLMSWQADTFVAPELFIPSKYIGWLELILALFILFKETTFITGLGMVLLYFIGVYLHGIFHMLDYVVYLAAGLYLVIATNKNEKIRNLDLPVLYSGLGFSLCWVAFEKLFYPYWGLSVLSKAPQLTMGLPHDFFLMSCAFVEFTLGYLLMICLLHRPLAVVITLVFFTTTSFFGKAEVVGHTLLHGALLVFVVKGPGRYYQAPIRIHSSIKLRSLFAVINYIILFAVLAFPYQKMAEKRFVEAKKTGGEMQTKPVPFDHDKTEHHPHDDEPHEH
jgi:uncharacterized membrane protein YphA (DoxX/SURF4 family)